MIRARFMTNSNNYRPVVWPIKHPYWCTGYCDGMPVLVAYADDEDEVLRNWPEAERIHSDEVEGYEFSDRFPRPKWLAEPEREQEAS